MTIEKIIEKAEKESNKSLVNLTKTIAYATQETYVKAMNDIYKQVGAGKVDHFTAYKKTVDELTQKGITLKTKDNRQEKLEVAVRRGLFGSLHQTANEISKKVGEDIDYNCVVIGHSYTCRPSHNVIDDVVMSKDEFAKYEYLTEEYGCNHVVNYDWREEFEGINNKREYGSEHMDNEECKRNYEIQQKARYYERMIREKKNVINRGDTSDKAKQELKLAQIKYKTYCNNNGLKVDYKKTWKSNFDDNKQNVSLPYKDVMKEWLNKVASKNHKVRDKRYFDYNGTKYQVDNKNVVLDYSIKEKEVAEWLSIIFNEDVEMIPRINKPDGISTPDYFFRGEYWDLKEIKSSGKRTVDNRINGTKRQSNNYILDITGNILTNDEVKKQIQNIYYSKDRKWVDKIILKRDKELIVVYTRKKIDPQPIAAEDQSH